MTGVAARALVPRTMRWLDPLLLGSNAAVFAVVKLATATTKVVFAGPFVPTAAERRGRPLVYVTWHRFNYVATPIFLSLPPEERPTLIMHDGLASRALTHRSSAWAGFETFAYRRRSRVSPREQIIAYVRSTGRPILNLPDSGGPYGVVKPGILEIARACDALLVPFHVTATSSITVGKKLRHVMPLPFGRIEVRRGTLLDADATVDDCQRALDALA